MNLNEFAKEIHANAVAHGWWDEPRAFDELCALMISELSEALEEARAGRPMEWYSCPITHKPCPGSCGMACDPITMGPKPEGVAVEMADCAIRIMDYLSGAGWDIEDYLELMGLMPQFDPVEDLSVAFMKATHELVCAWMCVEHRPQDGFEKGHFMTALVHVLQWFKANDLNFEAIARRKHEYNKSRPYKHGKVF